jgi:hypothetical protein
VLGPPTALVSFNHAVVEAQSPRLLYSATLGIGNSINDNRNPNGVAAVLDVKGNPLVRCTRAHLSTTPLGLRNSMPPFPG